MTTARADLAAAVEGVMPEALDLSHRVHANPEIAFQERQAAAWTAELLARNGFEVIAPAGGLETAFVARWPGDRPGPVIAFAASTTRCPRSAMGAGTT